MHHTGFFRLGWLIQLAVGVTLFTVSFLIENQVLQAFFAAPGIALTLAVALEAGKAMAIVWHRYMTYRDRLLDEPARLARRGGPVAPVGAIPEYPADTRLISGGFRLGLVVLSMTCSVLFLGVQLDRPNLEAAKAEGLAADRAPVPVCLRAAAQPAGGAGHRARLRHHHRDHYPGAPGAAPRGRRPRRLGGRDGRQCRA